MVLRAVVLCVLEEASWLLFLPHLPVEFLNMNLFTRRPWSGPLDELGRVTARQLCGQTYLLASLEEE